jgi:glycolate oxidase FAD binding subunit
VTAETSAHKAFEGPEVELSTDVAAFAFDDVAPEFIARPSTQQGVAGVLRAANEQRRAVFPRGGGTQMAYGMPPERGGLVLDTRGVDRVVEYTPADLTVTVEAGITLSRLQSVLAESGQWLPFDPPCDEDATIGGLLATNASGPARHSRGTARDLVIGMQFVTAEGELVKSGGRVVKNVAGYDLGKLQIGALGTLGVITQATFKVAPLPAATLNLVAVGEKLANVQALTTELAGSQLPVEGLALVFRGASTWSLQIRIAAGHAAVERSRSEIEALGDEHDIGVSEATDEAWRGPATLLQSGNLLRASVPQSTLPQLSEHFADIAATFVAYPSAGVAHIVVTPGTSADAVVSLRRRCVDAGGALVIERGPLELRCAAGVWGEPRGDFALMQRLKAELDPNRVLNPGRFIGGI